MASPGRPTNARRTASRPSVRPGARPGQRLRGVSARSLPRPRLTGRAAILLAVLSVLTISYASSVRAYLQQQREIRSLHGQITKSNAEIKALEKEELRWQDPAYKEQMAREKFGFVKQGEIGFIVLDAQGNPLDRNGTLDAPKTQEEKPSQWYDATWASVQAADHPPEEQPAAPPPADQIPAP